MEQNEKEKGGGAPKNEDKAAKAEMDAARDAKLISLEIDEFNSFLFDNDVYELWARKVEVYAANVEYLLN